MSFSQFDLNSLLLKSLHQLNHSVATPIQQKVIPSVLMGKDVVASAQTGTGKTAAYLLPALELITRSKDKDNFSRILILTPTRELASQVKDAALAYGKHLSLNVASVLGGMPYREQLRQFSKPVDIIVATPGRLMDLVSQKQVSLSAIEMFILDEADRMLDMGFIDDVKAIAKLLPKKRQTLLFTATINKQLTELANSILHHPLHLEASGNKVTVEKIEQRFHFADSNEHKLKLLEHVLTTESVYKSIIFSKTKRGADSLARILREEGFKARALHGDMRQPIRNKTILHLRQGKIQLLVATDVASRGIDIHDLSHVINYDLPQFAEDYVHRIGRTGRAGKSGIAITFVGASEMRMLKSIERYTQQSLSFTAIKGLEPRSTPNREQKNSHKKRSRKKFTAAKPQHVKSKKPAGKPKKNRKHSSSRR